jgi:hypothetical protein
MAMNVPLNIESLLWMAAPMVAWSRGLVDAAPSKAKGATRVRSKPTFRRAPRKRGRAVA